MTSEDIYSILASKPHNPHYLKRYLKFIESCTHTDGEYTENHHICPKAKDLFPEYGSFRKYPWNKKKLTARQHIIAHIMLWKAYGGSQTRAIQSMLDHFNSETCLYLSKRIIPTAVKNRYLSLLREEKSKLTSLQHKGKSTFKDSDGNKYYLPVDDPLIKELNLVGNNTGHKFSEESKHNLRNCNRKTSTVYLYFLDCKTKVRYNSDPEKYEQLLAQGWLPYYTKDDLDYIKILQYKKSSKKHKGRTRYSLPDGTYYARLPKDHPDIQRLNLVPQSTEKQKEQAREQQIKMAESLVGRKIYTNGVIEIKCHEHPGEGWYEGRKPRSKSHSENHRKATSEKRRNTFVVNDGYKNIYLKIGEPIPEGYSLGMAPRRK